MKNKNVFMMLDNKEFYLNDINYAHFKSLPPIIQESIRQKMILKYLENDYNKI